MTSKPKLKPGAFASIHQSAKALHKVGAISKTTLREFDEACLSMPPSFEPKDIKRLRELHHVSQPIFARYLNTTESTVQKWEAGAKRPSGTALKLLSVVHKHGLAVLA